MTFFITDVDLYIGLLNKEIIQTSYDSVFSIYYSQTGEIYLTKLFMNRWRSTIYIIKLSSIIYEIPYFLKWMLNGITTVIGPPYSH